MQDGDRRLGVQGRIGLARKGPSQVFDVGWAGPDHFWLRSEGTLAASWGGRHWIEDQDGHRRLRNLRVGHPVADFFDVDQKQRLELVRIGEPVAGTNLVNFTHGASAGTLDLALGMVTRYESPDVTFWSEVGIAELEAPAGALASRGATLVVGMPAPSAGRWEAYVGVSLEKGAVDAANRSPNSLRWSDVLDAATPDRATLHGTSEATFRLWDLIGSRESLSHHPTLDGALSRARGLGCGWIDIRVDTPDGGCWYFREIDGTMHPISESEFRDL